MPLTPAQRAAYGPDWPDVVRTVAERAGGRCECMGECGWARHLTEQHDRRDLRCTAVNREPSPYTGSVVVLTTAHLDHNPGVNDLDRLRHYCQGCHLAYDRAARTATGRTAP